MNARVGQTAARWVTALIALGACQCKGNSATDPSSLSAQQLTEGDTLRRASQGLSDSTPDEAEAKAAKVRLSVRVLGLRNSKGAVSVALFTSAEGFPESSAAARVLRASISKDQVSIVFSGLKRGRYALAAHHDENGNGRMDYNLIGIPTEGFAFSNDAKAMFGPPSFADAAFDVSSDRAEHVVTAQYF